MYIFFSRLRA